MTTQPTMNPTNAATATAIAKVDCPKCQGHGSQVSLDDDERDKGIEDTCYACAGEGKVDPEDAEEMRQELALQSLALHLASAHVHAERRSAENDEHGEGWAFRAAEHGLREGDYTRARIWECEGEAAEVLSRLHKGDGYRFIHMLQSLVEENAALAAELAALRAPKTAAAPPAAPVVSAPAPSTKTPEPMPHADDRAEDELSAADIPF